ncbi:LTA synthase family protein [Ewingella americana]|uniref:LTA synthase family protein n=1 Tax=Ewingella americana TaxID=41202 RepID=UPI0012AE2659|nr:sulfatase-like hydrolase/transferase [Ewingella americana]MRT04142.1 sulfatase-like hydrolase/transferase [Ewingella americana]
MNLRQRHLFLSLIPLLSVLITTFVFFVFNISSYQIIFFSCVEVILFYFVISFISNKYIRFAFWTLYCIILGAQVSSIVNTGSYVIPLTLTNLTEFKAVGHGVLYQVLSIIVLYFLLSTIIFFVSIKKPSRYSLVFLLILPFINGPINQFVQAGHQLYKQLTYKPNYNYPEVAKKFLKFDIYHHEDMGQYFGKGTPKNVIVIFTEGMSSHVVDRENNLGLGVTPNLDSLYSQGLIFKNYYNHTAATFRGLRGQLSSAYQYRDGVDGKGEGFFQIDSDKVKKTYDHRLISLPEILNEHGYSTYFIAATEDKSNLNALLRTMPFEKVFGMEDFGWHENDRMSDKKIFSALREVVSQQKNKPFFIGMYSSGTHHGMDSPDERYKNGQNPFYNKFYNYDFQLGEFIKWFKSSPYYDNTLLIITADHSSFPVPQFKSSFNTTTDFFVDSIPLVMIGANAKHLILDAKGNNSLSLAPTILQILNVNNAPNYFLGCSLFDLKCSSPFSHLSVIGDSYYKVYQKKDGSYDSKETTSSGDVADFYNVSG